MTLELISPPKLWNLTRLLSCKDDSGIDFGFKMTTFNQDKLSSHSTIKFETQFISVQTS